MILWFYDSLWKFRNYLQKSGLGRSQWESLLTKELDGSNELLKWVADSETGFRCGDLGHLYGKLLSLDAWEGSNLNKTQIRGCFTKRYLQGLVLLRKRGKGWLQLSLWSPHFHIKFLQNRAEGFGGSCLKWRPIWVPWQDALPESLQSDQLLPGAGAMQKGRVKWQQLLGNENKRKLSG